MWHPPSISPCALCPTWVLDRRAADRVELEEAAEVSREQDGLLEEDGALGDHQIAIGAPQPVLSVADPAILLGVEPGAVEVEVREHLIFVVLERGDHDVGDQPAGARRRILGPCIAGAQPGYPGSERAIIVVEQGDLARRGELTIQILAGFGPTDGHPVADVLREEGEPRLILPRVEKMRLTIVELFHLLLKQQILHRIPTYRRGFR